MKTTPFEYILPVVAAFGLSKSGLLPRFEVAEKVVAEAPAPAPVADDQGGAAGGLAAAAVIGMAGTINSMTPETALTMAKAGIGGPQAPAGGGGGSRRQETESGANRAMTAAIESGMKSVEGSDIEDALGFRSEAANGAGGSGGEDAPLANASKNAGEAEGAAGSTGAAGGDGVAAAAEATSAGESVDALAGGSAKSEAGEGASATGDAPKVGASDAGSLADTGAPEGAAPASSPPEGVDPDKLDFLQRSNLVLGKLLDNQRSVDPFGMVMDPGSSTVAPVLADQYEEVPEATTVSNSALKNALMSLPITGVYPSKGLIVIGARSFPVGGQFGMRLQDLTIRLRFEGIRGGEVFFQDLETREITSIPYDARPAEFEPLRKGGKLATGNGIVPMNDLYIAN